MQSPLQIRTAGTSGASAASCCGGGSCCAPAPAAPGPADALLVRPATAADAAEVVDLTRASGVEVAFDPAEFHVAERDGRVVACARLRPFPDGTRELASVAVEPHLRGVGVGARLVRDVLAHADGPVHALAVAPGFFLKLGFREAAEAPPALRPKLEGECSSRAPTVLLWTPDPDQARQAIRARYGAIARQGRADGEGLAPGAYAPDELAALPEGAYLALGTGHPVRAARLQPGETLVDLGSGAGVDVLLAAREVGPAGRAVGVDFTPDMVARARANAARTGLANAEFVEGPIEAIPLPDATADAVTSNCVVNLSTDKNAVLREAHRVLRPGGRLVVSDTLRLRGLAPSEAPSCDCTTGAMSEDEWRERLAAAGFADVQVERQDLEGTDPCCGGPAVGRVLVRAVKPA